MARMLQLAILATIAVVMVGCPGAGSSLAGTWVFVVDGTQIGVTLEPNGEATSFILEAQLSGTLTWHVHGDQFIMDQTVTNTSTRVIYSALITNDGSTLEGARVVWMGGTTGTAVTFAGNKT